MSFAPKYKMIFRERFPNGTYTGRIVPLEDLMLPEDWEDATKLNRHIRLLLARCGLKNTGRDAVKFVLRMQNLINNPQ